MSLGVTDTTVAPAAAVRRQSPAALRRLRRLKLAFYTGYRTAWGAPGLTQPVGWSCPSHATVCGQWQGSEQCSLHVDEFKPELSIESPPTHDKHAVVPRGAFLAEKATVDVQSIETAVQDKAGQHRQTLGSVTSRGLDQQTAEQADADYMEEIFDFTTVVTRRSQHQLAMEKKGERFMDRFYCNCEGLPPEGLPNLSFTDWNDLPMLAAVCRGCQKGILLELRQFVDSARGLMGDADLLPLQCLADK